MQHTIIPFPVKKENFKEFLLLYLVLKYLGFTKSLIYFVYFLLV